MDQSKIGQFIARTRKSKNLTQRQLADLLSISDKTVSKWETGKGLPDVSLMLPLCRALDLTVNDLLTGEKVPAADYQTKAEENMMDLIQENQENKKRMVLSVICGTITIIAVCSLIIIASYLELPAAVRVLLILLAVATAVAGIGAAAVLDAQAAQQAGVDFAAVLNGTTPAKDFSPWPCVYIAWDLPDLARTLGILG